MKILALDTSGTNLSTCIIDEEKVLSDFNLNIGTTHSVNLIPMIDTMQKYSQISLDDIDAFACSIGPGSFTGLRIGISTIKAFALAHNKPVIGVPTLVGLAYNISNFDGIICSILDAKNDNVYAALFKYEYNKPVMIENYITDTIDVLLENLRSKNEKVIFVGDGSISFKEKISETLNKKAYFAPLHLNNQLSTSIAKAALEKAKLSEYETYDTLMPMYLKKTQAEREAEKNNK